MVISFGWQETQWVIKQKKQNYVLLNLSSAEREGFEPPVPLSTSVFKTGAIDHSAISPKSGTPSGIRTLDPLIKSQLLYQLS